jgi:hypothetical protein
MPRFDASRQNTKPSPMNKVRSSFICATKQRMSELHREDSSSPIIRWSQPSKKIATSEASGWIQIRRKHWQLRWKVVDSIALTVSIESREVRPASSSKRIFGTITPPLAMLFQSHEGEDEVIARTYKKQTHQ